MHSRKLPFQAQTVLLLNDGIADRKSSLPNPLRRFFLLNGISLPNSAHKSVPFLYQFLVLTDRNPEVVDQGFVLGGVV
jgi:hypothetical protein